MALDITRAQVRDLELPPLSPYSVKYCRLRHPSGQAQHVDVNYQVQPRWANSPPATRLILNQLSFGDKVEGSSASLPVKLAVALAGLTAMA
jgi:hypothetical protein